MTNFIGWTPPPGVAVVEPPVHPETKVAVIYSDGEQDEFMPARCLNWSAVGDGPAIVAYAVVQEYKPAPEPREWFIVGGRLHESRAKAQSYGLTLHQNWREIIHVREVPDPSREVVAWAVVRKDGELSFTSRFENLAHDYAQNTGGTVVRLSGVMPNE